MSNGEGVVVMEGGEEVLVDEIVAVIPIPDVEGVGAGHGLGEGE